jgi:hypothetical protein
MASFNEVEISTVTAVKFTQHFQAMRLRPDRAMIQLEWIQRVIDHPLKEVIQQDGRIRRWAPIVEMNGRVLRVILLPDGETVHNAFFDRSFTL